MDDAREIPYKAEGRQMDFHKSGAKFRAFCGGYGCVAGETLVGGVPIKNLTSPGEVKTLFGKFSRSDARCIGEADLYKVTTQSGLEVSVTLSHRFLTLTGWNQLRHLRVGELIAVDGGWRESSDSEIGRDFQVGYSARSHQDGGLPSPVLVAAQDRLRQLRNTDGGSNALFLSSLLSIEDFYFHKCPSFVEESRLVLGVCGSSRGLLHSRERFLEEFRQLRIELGLYPSEDRGEPYTASSFGIDTLHTGLLVDSSYNTLPVWDTIVKIGFLRNDDYFDIQVPDANHYLAQGIYHHNCGKTLAGVVEDVKTALQYPGSKGLIGRLTDGELRATTWKDFLTVMPEEMIAEYNKADLYVKLKNGSEIWGKMLQSEEKLRSFNLGWWHIDECCEVGEAIFKQLKARTRHRKGPLRGWITGNPEARNWVYKTFVSPDKENSNYQYFHGKTKDASFLPREYIEDLYNTYDAEWVERFLEGSWDVYMGQVFPMFDREMHVLPGDFEIPRHWPRYRGLDHGTNDPTACVWVAVDDVGNHYVYRTFYRNNTTINQNVSSILEWSKGEEYDFTVMDPGSNRREASTGRRTWDFYREAGLPLIGASSNNLTAGIARLREMFDPKPNRSHPLTETHPAPRLYILSHCRELISELQQYRFRSVDENSKNASNDPVDKFNHAIDALRYVVMHNPMNAQLKAEPGWEEWFEELEQKFNPKRLSQDDIIGNERIYW